MKPFTIKLRIGLVVGVTAAVVVLMAARLMNIQIVDADFYKALLDSRYTSTQEVKAVRGEIIARGGEPLATNNMGYDVILDKAFLPRSEQNVIILRLIELFEREGEKWNDNLPLVQASASGKSAGQSFAIVEGIDAEVERLRKLLDVQEYATADQLFYWLTERYDLQDYPLEDARKIAGVRYEMEQRGFAMNVPYTFAADIGISTVVNIKEHSYELSGVDIAESASRSYENSDVAPHIIGTIGPIYQEEYQALKEQGYAMDDTIGKSGVESALEDSLRGRNGKREIFIGSGGEVIKAVESEPPVPGNTVVLTIDMDLQRVAQQALDAQIKNLQRTAPAGEGREADSGAVVMLSAKTGEVLAAATYPSYDLKTYREEYTALLNDELRPLYNRATMGVYAPGSTFKPAVAIAGISGGVIDDHSTVHCGRVYTYYTGYHPTCLSYHGSLNLTRALAVSCNIFFYDVGRRTGIENITKYARQLGLGADTGIEIANAQGQNSTPEVKAVLSNEEWYPGDVLQSSIGQLYNEYTPLQLANYAATIGNRGKRMKLTVVHEIRDYSKDTVVQPLTPQVYETVDAPPEAFEMVVTGMVAASRSGSARATFGSYPIDVAAKTGTPETTSGLPNSTFICFAPAENPQVAIAVVIEKGWHGYTGAPVAKELMDHYFGYNTNPVAVPDPGEREDIQSAAGLESSQGESRQESQAESQPEA